MALLGVTSFQVASNLGFFTLDWLFPDEEQQEQALLHFPHGIPALAGGRNGDQGCSAAPRMSHGSSRDGFSYKYSSDQPNKQNWWLEPPSGPLGWKCPLGWWPGSGFRDRDIDGDTAGSVWDQVGTGNTQTPQECGVQNGTAALALVLPPLQVFVPPQRHGDSHGVSLLCPQHLPQGQILRGSPVTPP